MSGTSINPLTVWETNSAINQNVAIRFTYSMCPPSPANPAPLPPSLCSSAVSLTSSAQPGPAQPCLWESKNPWQNRKWGTPKPQLLNTKSNRAASSSFFCSHTACEACSRTRSHGPLLLRFPQCYMFSRPHVSVPPVLCLEPCPSWSTHQIPAHSAKSGWLNHAFYY